MDTQKLARFAQYERQCFGLVFDPRAEASERWLCQIGLDVAEVGPTAQDALDSAMSRLILGPECRMVDSPDDVDDQPALPFAAEPDDVAPPEDDWRAAWSMRPA